MLVDVPLAITIKLRRCSHCLVKPPCPSDEFDCYGILLAHGSFALLVLPPYAANFIEEASSTAWDILKERFSSFFMVMLFEIQFAFQ